MCKLKYLILITLFGKLLFPQQSFSQVPYLNKTFLINGNYNLINSIIPSDSGYIVAFSYGNTLCLLDSSANVKWERNYSFFNMTPFLTKILPIANNEYIITGTCQNGTAQNNLIFAIKLNSIFDTIYSKVLLRDSITCNGCLHSNTVIETTNNNLLFAGVHTKDSNDVSTGNRNGLFLLTDSSSNILRRVTIGPQNDDEGFASAIQMGNYYYLFGATRSYAPSYVTNPFDRNDGWVVKTDLQGNEVASAAFGHPELYDMDFRYALPLSGNKILTGQYYSYEKNVNGFLMTKPWLLILNEDLSINKQIFFRNASISGDTLFSIGFIHGVLRSDSNLAFLGINSAYNMNAYIVIRKEATITVLDRNLKVRYNRYFIHTGNVFNNLNPSVITPTSDGGYIFGGYVVDNTLTPSQQAWLVKTDSLGCDGFMSCNDTALVCQILQSPDTVCKNDTALIRVKFKGRSAPYFVYANNVLVLDSVYYPYSLPLWIDTLVSFIPHDTGMQQVVIKVKDPWGWYRSDSVQVYVKNCNQGFASQNFYKHKIEIYPNPVTDEIHIRIRGILSGEYTITLYEMHGILIKKIITSSPEITLDISQLPRGVYNIRVLGNNMVRIKKIIKSEP
ncbi:MAG: T9SS type A sorting domain-containing protein [Bacteroidales bacterium]|nr:T9SS type A sorting domain-containing protein [Bacteroidales bacterium]